MIFTNIFIYSIKNSNIYDNNNDEKIMISDMAHEQNNVETHNKKSTITFYSNYTQLPTPSKLDAPPKKGLFIGSLILALRQLNIHQEKVI